jgi:hypothetical protein
VRIAHSGQPSSSELTKRAHALSALGYPGQSDSWGDAPGYHETAPLAFDTYTITTRSAAPSAPGNFRHEKL